MRSGGNTSAMSTAIAPTPRAGLSVSVTLLDAMALRAAVALVALVAVALLGCGGATAPLVGAPAPADGGAAPDSPSPPSSPCGYAVDITAGGTFHGDTCEGKSASIPHCSPNARVALFERLARARKLESDVLRHRRVHPRRNVGSDVRARFQLLRRRGHRGSRPQPRVGVVPGGLAGGRRLRPIHARRVQRRFVRGTGQSRVVPVRRPSRVRRGSILQFQLAAGAQGPVSRALRKPRVYRGDSASLADALMQKPVGLRIASAWRSIV